MKQGILLFALLLTFTGCKVHEKPEFIKIENIKVIESDGQTIKLSADAFFNNPNDIGGKLRTDGIKVFVNDLEMGTLTSEEFDVPAKKEFSIPLIAHISTDRLVSDESLGGLLGSLFSKKMKVQYIGEIKYKVFGFSHTYIIDKVEDVKIKL